MNIHQLSVNYLHEQDRILVRINSADAQEIRLWLTRRLCLGWAPVLRDTLDTPQANEPNGKVVNHGQSNPAWIGEFQHLQNLKDSDFSTPFKADAKSWPLGSEPLLVTTVHIAPGGDGGVEMRFEESVTAHQAQERSFQAVMAAKLAHGFMHLLELAMDASEWEQDSQTSHARASTNEMEEHPPRQMHQYLH